MDDINQDLEANTPGVVDDQDAHKNKHGIWVFTGNEIYNGIIQFVSVVVALIFGVWAVKSFDASQRANSLAESALQQSLLANQLALLALCTSDEVIGNSDACAEVFAAIAIPSVVAALSITTSIPITISLSPSSARPTPGSIIPTTSITSTTTIIPPPPPPPPASTSTFLSTTFIIPTTTIIPPPSALSTTVISPVPSSGAPPTSKRHPLSLGAIVGLIVGTVGAFTIFLAALLGYRRVRLLNKVRAPS